MADAFRKARSGDPLRIPVRAYNAFVDAAIDQRSRFHATAVDHQREMRSSGLVLVRNQSGHDADRFAALGVDGPVFLPDPEPDPGAFARRVHLVGVTPRERDHVGRFVVAQAPIPADRVGPALAVGITPARVLVEDERDAFADIAEADTVLRSGAAGSAAILWKEPGTGERWAVVEVGRPRRDRLTALLGAATPIPGQRFGWRYDWQEARPEGDPASPSFGRYVPWPHGLGSAGDPTLRARNRFEHHLATAFPVGSGTEGYAHVGVCGIPGVLENCPPAQAVRPTLAPIMPGVAVELTAERDTRGQTAWSFEALNAIKLAVGERGYVPFIPGEGHGIGGHGGA